MKPFHMDNYQVICVIFIYFHIKKLDLCSIFHRLNPSCGKSFVIKTSSRDKNFFGLYRYLECGGCLFWHLI